MRSTLALLSMSIALVASAGPGAGRQAPRASDDGALTQAIMSLGEHGRFIGGQPELRGQLREHLQATQYLAAQARAANLQESADFQLRLKQAEDHILASLYRERLLAQATEPAALERYANSHAALFARKQVKVAHLLLRRHDTAQAQLERLRGAPQNFQAVVREHSQGADAAHGGELPWFAKGTYALDFESAAFSTPVGEVYPQVIKSASGYHIIMVLAEQRSTLGQPLATKLAEVRAWRLREVREQLRAEASASAAADKRRPIG